MSLARAGRALRQLRMRQAQARRRAQEYSVLGVRATTRFRDGWIARFAGWLPEAKTRRYHVLPQHRSPAAEWGSASGCMGSDGGMSAVRITTEDEERERREFWLARVEVQAIERGRDEYEYEEI